MNTPFHKPKGFGELLDHTFRLSKNRFSDLFKVLVVILGPIYLLQAIVDLATGTSFFREVGSGGAWYEQIISSFDTTEPVPYTETNLGADIGLILIGLVSILLAPVAEAGILITIQHIKDNEEFTLGKVMKKAFSRFWPMFGSNLLFGLIVFGLIIVPSIIIPIVGIFGAGLFLHSTIIGVLLAIVVFLGALVGIAYLVTRWSFYFGSVVLDKDSPGLGRSWRLTRKRTWAMMGLYIVFFLITVSISTAVELTLGLILGNSVLFTLITNLISLFTTMIFSVGYALMYLDLKTRNEAGDLKEMIEDYQQE